jgi:hypothetical protein
MNNRRRSLHVFIEESIVSDITLNSLAKGNKLIDSSRVYGVDDNRMWLHRHHQIALP